MITVRFLYYNWFGIIPNDYTEGNKNMIQAIVLLVFLIFASYMDRIAISAPAKTEFRKIIWKRKQQSEHRSCSNDVHRHAAEWKMKGRSVVCICCFLYHSILLVGG